MSAMYVIQRTYKGHFTLKPVFQIYSIWQWRSQPDDLFLLCKFHVITIIYFLEIHCFHIAQHVLIVYPKTETYQK